MNFNQYNYNAQKNKNGYYILMTEHEKFITIICFRVIENYIALCSNQCTNDKNKLVFNDLTIKKNAGWLLVFCWSGRLVDHDDYHFLFIHCKSQLKK